MTTCKECYHKTSSHSNGRCLALEFADDGTLSVKCPCQSHGGDKE